MPELSRIAGLHSPDVQPDDVMRAAGYAVILASAATALLPAGHFDSGPAIVGSLMIFVGALEMLANALRKRGRWATMAAGAVSIATGLLIFGQPVTTFATTVYVVIGWLAIRALLLAISAVEIPSRVNFLSLVAAAMDITLAGIVWLGFTASTLVLALFGPTEPMISNFAWVLAISFVSAGLLLVGFANDQATA